MSGILKPSITETYDEYQKARYIGFLNELGSNIRFEDDTWICDKRRRSFAEYLMLYPSIFQPFRFSIAL